MKEWHFADQLEKNIAQALLIAGIDFVHESQDKDQGLDFYLPKYDVYIEVKQFHADRISRQMASKDNVIAVQGKKSVAFIINMIENLKPET